MNKGCLLIYHPMSDHLRSLELYEKVTHPCLWIVKLNFLSSLRGQFEFCFYLSYPDIVTELSFSEANLLFQASMSPLET